MTNGFAAFFQFNDYDFFAIMTIEINRRKNRDPFINILPHYLDVLDNLRYITSSGACIHVYRYSGAVFEVQFCTFAQIIAIHLLRERETDFENFQREKSGCCSFAKMTIVRYVIINFLWGVVLLA